MIPRKCKRLAEVDFPIAVVSKHAAREKSIRHGHPSTLHLWWARRPLASSRAMLLALLLPDPCDAHCPETFKREARRILRDVRQSPAGDASLRKALLKFTGDFANWDLAADPTYLRVGRGLVRAAHGNDAPLVVDPFAGGGSIPLEALRLGCEAFASDLNPVACLILKVMLEDIPRHDPGLADELRRVGGEIKTAAERELAHLYPRDPDGATPIAYLWARTIRCEAPNCGAEIPLIRSLWLCKKVLRKRGLRPKVQRAAGESPRVEFEIFEPGADKDVRTGTVARANATCVCCASVLPPKRVRAQLAAQGGGADVIFDEKGERTGGAVLLAVVTVKPGKKGRHYRLPTQSDYKAVHKAQERVSEIVAKWERGGREGICPVPDEPISLNEVRRISVPIYGVRTWGDLFTARQKAALLWLSKAVRNDSAQQKTKRMLGCAFSRVAMSDMSCTRWNAVAEKIQHTFGRQAIPIVWDFAEVVVTAPAPGNWASGYGLISDVVTESVSLNGGQVQQADATDHPLPDQSAYVWFTDPPYYDAVPYAHLADFFFVWLRRTIPDDPLLSGSFDSSSRTTPKACEIVVDRPHRLSTSRKNADSYEQGMAQAFADGRRTLRDDGVGSVVFAHKTTEGWEALLSGMIRGGWTLTGSWPIATEMGTRLNARDTASLATSVHLVCRPRPEDAPIGDWGVVLSELPERVGDWMERLEAEGVRGADLVFACIGPALEIFSRYRQVETPDGREIGLPKYLEKVWEVVGRTALENILGAAEAKARNGLAGALEEDARLTALFLWTLQTTRGETTDAKHGETPASAGTDEDVEETPNDKAAGFTLVFDVVRRFAQPLGINLQKWEKRTIQTKKGVVRLLPVTERALDLFGERGSQAIAARLEREAAGGPDGLQGVLFPKRQEQGANAVREKRPNYSADEESSENRTAASAGATTLDRVHTGMLLQAAGQTNGLRALLKTERERGPDFLRLSNALSALYPRGSEEKRLLDGMLLAAK